MFDLKEIFFREPSPVGKVVDESNLVPFLKTLEEHLGAERAIEVFSIRGPNNLLNGEQLLDRFYFINPPESYKEKIEQIITFTELAREFEDVDRRDTSIKGLTNNFDEFVAIHKKLLEGDKYLTTIAFFRDTLTGVPFALAELYGVEGAVRDDSEEQYHIVEQGGSSNRKLIAIPGFTTSELVDYLIKKSEDSNGVQHNYIIEGFDTPQAALEVTTLVNSYQEARLYTNLGFTSLKGVQEANLEDLKKLSELFSYHDSSEFKRIVGSHVQGKNARVKKLLDLGEDPMAKEYLQAFDGNVQKTKAVLSKEDKPSAESISYLRTQFYQKQAIKEPNLKTLLAESRAIDAPHLFSDKIETKEAFLKMKAEYDQINNRYKEEVDDSKDLDSWEWEKLKEVHGDWRFLRDFSYQNENLDVVRSAMSFDEYEAIPIRSFKSRTLPHLLRCGYSVNQIMNACRDGVENIDLIAQRLEDNTTPLEHVVIASKIKGEGGSTYALRMLAEVPFDKHKLPYGLVSSFRAHDFTSNDVNLFLDAQNLDLYRIEGGFDGVGLVEDLLIFYNKIDKQEATPQIKSQSA